MYRHYSKSERGQSLVEMALALPALVLILSGLLDIGRIYYTNIALEEAAAEAALYLSLNPQCPNTRGGMPRCANPNNAKWRALHTSSTQELDPARLGGLDGTGFVYDPNLGVGNTVEVELTYPFDFVTPGIRAIANAVTNGAGLTLRAPATQIILIED